MIFDKFPYTNFHELNLHYFLVHFKEIFEQWNELYNTMLAWKAATEAGLVQWKSDTEAGLVQWKSDTEDDIEDWEDDVLANLETWKTAFQTLFDETFSNLSAIKDAAEDARDAAEGYADDAQGYAEDAQAAAATLVPDPTLTEPNQPAEAKATGDAIDVLDNTTGTVHTTWVQGRIGANGQHVDANYSIHTNFIPASPGDRFITYDYTEELTRGRYYWYASDESYLGTNATGIAPANTAYMRTHVNLGSGNTITPSDGVNYPILHVPNVLSVETGGRFVFSQNSTDRLMSVPVSCSIGDRVIFAVTEWGGNTASQYTLYGVSGGSNTVLKTVSDLFEFATYTFTTAYDGLAIGASASAPSSSVTFTAVVYKVGRDKISPVVYSLGKSIEGVSGRVSTIEEEVTGLSIPELDNVNLYDKSTDTTGYAIDETGTIIENQYYEYSALIAVTPGKKYHVYSTAISSASSRLRVHAYDSSEAFIRQVNTKFLASGVGGAMRIEFVAISPYVRIVLRTTNTNTHVSEGGLQQRYVVQNTDSDELTYVPNNSFALSGKKFSILGASISTFDGYIPEGYSEYYPHTTNSDYPVQTVHDMYWQKVIDATGMQLLVDNASAGSYCTTGHGADNMAGCGDRSEALDDGTTYPDIIIIQLGGNDFTRSTPLGEYNGTQDFPDPTDDASVTNTFREAYAVMLKKITTKYPKAKVFCGTIPIIKGGTYVTDTFPAKNKDQGAGKPGGIMLETYNDAIRELAKLFGCRVVEFSECGLTFNNVSTYMQDASGTYGQHPDRRGHSMMANAVLHALGQEFGGLV